MDTIKELKDKAVRNIYTQVVSVSIGDNFTEAFDIENVKVELDESKIATELTRLQSAYDNNKYQRDRATEYPHITDQLDMLYWDKINETEIWKNSITKIKEKFPKE
jgi:hypothetical protein